MSICCNHILFFTLLQLIYSCSPDMSPKKDRTAEEFIGGVTLVAPSRPFSRDPTLEIKQMGAGWVAIVPYGFTLQDEPTVIFNHSRQWWGETTTGIIETIRHCHNSGLKVMLKPQIWAHHMWSGDIDYHTDEAWIQWESTYRDFILQMAHTADSMDVEVLCIGTELKKSVENRPLFWNQMIDQLRGTFKGKLTYAANWDSYEVFPFWEKLDYIGVNAYFPLSEDRHPSRNQLVKAWKPILSKMKRLSQRTDKTVLFTEFGYLSTDYNTHNSWEKEDQINELPVNEAAQALALDVLFECFYPEDWWGGGFIWKWYPPDYRIRNKAKDYTVQDKEAQEVLSKWYNKL